MRPCLTKTLKDTTMFAKQAQFAVAAVALGAKALQDS